MNKKEWNFTKKLVFIIVISYCLLPLEIIIGCRGQIAFVHRTVLPFGVSPPSSRANRLPKYSHWLKWLNYDQQKRESGTKSSR